MKENSFIRKETIPVTLSVAFCTSPFWLTILQKGGKSNRAVPETELPDKSEFEIEKILAVKEILRKP